MKLTWLGHSGFRLEIEDQVLLIDPWMTGNPVFPADERAKATAGATHVLITHAHDDHAADALFLAQNDGATLIGMYDLVDWWASQHDIAVIGMNKGGTIHVGTVAITMVNAAHSSSMRAEDGSRICAGSEAGFMIRGEGKTIYVSGDTDIMADMEWMADYHKPEIGILCAGGHFTMDMARAAYAARRYFDFQTVIPCHYKTFPLLEQSADALISGLDGVDVIEPQVMVGISL